MKNKTYHILIALLVATFAACVEDTGNYDYLPVDEVVPGTITGIDPVYNIVSLDRLQINPTIENGLQDDNFYTWYLYPVPTSYDSSKDTIGREKQLDYQVVLPAGTYELLLEVKHKTHLTSSYATATLNVSWQFSNGWYITKQVGNDTDIDFIKLPDNTLYTDILYTINGQRPAGAPVANAYIATHYGYEVENPDGTSTILQDQPVFFVATTADFNVYNPANMNRIKEFKDAFFEPPLTRAPSALLASAAGALLVNDGIPYCLWTGLAYNIGRFSYRLLGGEVALAPHTTRYSSGFLLFDRASSSFLALNSYPGYELEELYAYAYPSSNLDVDLIYMQERVVYDGDFYAYALVKNKTTGVYTVLSIEPYYASMGYSPISRKVDVPAECEIINATIYAQHHTSANLYYSRGDNKLGYYGLTSKVETPDILDIPAGESIVHVSHVYSDYTTLNCLAVLTSNGNQWKLYCYNLQGATPAVQLPAFQVFTGEGNARSVLYSEVTLPAAN